ncbi:MAG: rRNA adenine N-6-methyltransferase family protein, partial [Balneolaceae bacterium]
MNTTFTYIKNFIKDRDVASITPTSLRCVKKVCLHMDFSKDINIVEYGPGNGVFSRYILGKITPHSRLILIEANENFVKQLRRSIKDDRVEIYNVLAGDILEIL